MTAASFECGRATCRLLYTGQGVSVSSLCILYTIYGATRGGHSPRNEGC